MRNPPTLHTRKANGDFNLTNALISIFISFVGALIALFPSNPNNMGLPSRDSGVFLYVSWRFINGDIPYRDVWDHKPPLIYFVDAIGLKLTPDSLWGVWFLQFIFIFLTILVIYRLLDREFGTAAAIAGTIALTSGLLTILDRGNVTEEYALLFQALSLWLIVVAWKNDFSTRTSFWIGLCGGLAFYSKQTTIGIWIVYALMLLMFRLSRRKSPLADFLFLLAGFLVPSVMFVAYFASQNALANYWDQAFLYNFVYIGKHEGIRRLIPVFIKGFLYLRKGGVLYLAAIGWLTGLAYAWVHRKNLFERLHPLILIGVVGLPIEVILINVSGRSILHYYLTPLPVMASLTGIIVYAVPDLLNRIPSTIFHQAEKWAPACLLATIILMQLQQIRSYPEYVKGLAVNDYEPVIEYVVENTRPEDKVLIIGAESVINFLAQREAPTRYVYQYPLALLGRREMFEEYFDQILTNRPVLIIDTRGRSELTEKLYVPLQKRSPLVRDGVEYLGRNYEQVAQFGDWFIYRLMETAPAYGGAPALQ